mmetsp:Transcript_2726/g.8223  ORF Transcript_2726/g.8223 Transcript_2726/m.8223 type:complete len:378 (+) Transcript_2726:378-1511(+)
MHRKVTIWLGRLLVAQEPQVTSIRARQLLVWVHGTEGALLGVLSHGIQHIPEVILAELHCAAPALAITQDRVGPTHQLLRRPRSFRLLVVHQRGEVARHVALGEVVVRLPVACELEVGLPVDLHNLGLQIRVEQQVHSEQLIARIAPEALGRKVLEQLRLGAQQRQANGALDAKKHVVPVRLTLPGNILFELFERPGDVLELRTLHLFVQRGVGQARSDVGFAVLGIRARRDAHQPARIHVCAEGRHRGHQHIGAHVPLELVGRPIQARLFDQVGQLKVCLYHVARRTLALQIIKTVDNVDAHPSPERPRLGDPRLDVILARVAHHALVIGRHHPARKGEGEQVWVRKAARGRGHRPAKLVLAPNRVPQVLNAVHLA